MRLLLLAALLLAAPVSAQTTVQPSPSDTLPPGVLAGLDAADSAPRTLDAIAIEPAAVDLDGVLDEPAWSTAPAATGFVQLRPSAGDPASERTEARVLYDDKAVYVGMRMHDSQADRINTHLGRRDSGLESDWAMVAFDSYHDERTAFLFQVSAAGVLSDALLYDDVNEDDSWDAVWDAAVSRDVDGWTAEFRIPLSQLRFAASEGEQTWGVEFSRKHFRTSEQTFWAPLDPEANGVVSQFGKLMSLRGLRAPRQLELQPYVASSLTRAPNDDALGVDPYYASNDLDPRVGLDLKYGLSSDLTLTATVNPDFGQVEADPAQVNLGGFELFFDERRPFFVEGRDAFSMEPRRFFSNARPDLLYTRRIGRSPQRTRFVPDGVYDRASEDGVYTDAPQQSTILGAAKLSGRVGPFSIGVLNAVTSREYGRFQAFDADGRPVEQGEALVEPLTNYAVARTKATFGRTIVGGLLTSVVREDGASALTSLLPQQATVAGLDLEHRLTDEWVVNGQLAGSYVSGSTDAITRLQTAFPRLYQRPDAGHLTLDTTRTSLSGLTGEVNVLKAGGEHWVGGLHTQFTSPGFDSNELGFQSRADNVGLGGVVVYQQNEAQGSFQRWDVNVFAGSDWNFDGDNRNAFIGGNASARLKSFWGGNMNWNLWPRTTGDRTTRGGPNTTDPAGYSISGNVSSDDRKPVSGYVWVGTQGTELGRRDYDSEVGVEVRPSSSVQIRVGPGLSIAHNPRQFVDIFEAPEMEATFGNRYVFGAIDQTTLSVEARVNWTFTPTLSLQTYVRPFVTRGQYDAFRQMTAPGQLDFPLFSDAEVAPNEDGSVMITPADGGDPFTVSPDFTVRALQGNAVLRWEYRPGSALFLVWQQQRNGFESDGAFRFGTGGRFFNDPVTNVFLVKLSYWLG